MFKSPKSYVLLIVNLSCALIGTAIVSTSIGRLYKPQSINGVVAKEWLLSILIAATIGFWAYRRGSDNEAAVWTWVLPAVWFTVRLITQLPGGNVVFKFSGAGCNLGLRAVECTNFFVFTIIFIRSVAYSLGAYGARSLRRRSTVSDRVR
jgi:hypothetical protein